MEPRRLMSLKPPKLEDIQHAMRFHQYIVREPDEKGRHRWLAFRTYQHFQRGAYFEAETQAAALALLLEDYRTDHNRVG